MPTDGKPKNGIVRQLFSYGGVSAMQTFVEFGVFAVLQLAGLPFRLANAVAVFCSGRSGASCCAATSSSNDVRAGRFSRRDHGKTDMLSYNGCASGNLWLREGRDAVGGCKTGNGTAPARV